MLRNKKSKIKVKNSNNYSAFYILSELISGLKILFAHDSNIQDKQQRTINIADAYIRRKSLTYQKIVRSFAYYKKIFEIKFSFFYIYSAWYQRDIGLLIVILE